MGLTAVGRSHRDLDLVLLGGACDLRRTFDLNALDESGAVAAAGRARSLLPHIANLKGPIGKEKENHLASSSIATCRNPTG